MTQYEKLVLTALAMIIRLVAARAFLDNDRRRDQSAVRMHDDLLRAVTACEYNPARDGELGH